MKADKLYIFIVTIWNVAFNIDNVEKERNKVQITQK